MDFSSTPLTYSLIHSFSHTLSNHSWDGTSFPRGKEEKMVLGHFDYVAGRKEKVHLHPKLQRDQKADKCQGFHIQSNS